MAKIDDAHRVEEGLSIEDEMGLFWSTDNPSQSPGFEAPRSSLLVQKPASSNASAWFKYGDGDTDWSSLATAPPRYILSYSHNGVLSNDWMGITSLTVEGRTISFNSEIVGIGFGNSNNGVDVDIEVYKNGQAGGNLVYTWEIRNFRYTSVQLVTPISFNAGDVIYVFGRDQGDNGSDVNLDIMFQNL